MRVAVVCLATACSFQPGSAPGTGADDTGPIDDTPIGSGDVDAATATADAADDTEIMPGVLVLRPDADAWLRQQYPTEAHGADGDLRSGSGSTIARANRILVHYDVASIPVACSIREARLFLYFFQEDFSVSPTLGAHRITVAWSEASTTWKVRTAGTNWSKAGGDFATTATATATITAATYGWKSWDLTALTIQWRDLTQPNYGVAIVEPIDAAGNDGGKLFYSMQSSTMPTDLRPYVRVTCN
jgi:hypothetical protein